jgi:hypothetical protein
LYDPVSNTFAESTPVMNLAHLQAVAALLPNGKVLIAGGAFGENARDTELYDPVGNTFANGNITPGMVIGRNLATATLLPNGNVLIAGGIGTAALSSTELYFP